MHSDKPKVLHELAGCSLLAHVINCAHQLRPGKVIVVYGFGGDAVPEAINDSGIIWVKQEVQLGTGHAVKQALPHLDKDSITLVLLGDVPLISATSCSRLIEQARNNLALFTAEKSDPTGYGRVIRDLHGRVQVIVEEKDATEKQRAIHEVNTGIMAMPTQRLAGWLALLQNRNAQGEYYLTDIVAMAVRDGVGIVTCSAQDEWEVMGVNSKDDLACLERVSQQRYAAQLMERGVTLRDPERLDIRGDPGHRP